MTSLATCRVSMLVSIEMLASCSVLALPLSVNKTRESPQDCCSATLGRSAWQVAELNNWLLAQIMIFDPRDPLGPENHFSPRDLK